MFSLPTILAVLSVAASVSSLTTPHHLRTVHHRRALAARAPSPVADPASLDSVQVVRPRKRKSGSRCKPAPNSSSKAPAAATPAPAANAGADPANDQPASPTTKKNDHQPSPAHTPSPTPKEEPSPTTQAPPAVTGNLPSFLVGTQTGDGTFYGIGLGSCGWTNGGDDRIAAVSWKLYDNFPGYKGGNPNLNPVCGRKVTAHYNGKSTQVTIVDRCTGCAETDLDFSPAAFNDLASFDLGRIHGVKWTWD